YKYGRSNVPITLAKMKENSLMFKEVRMDLKNEEFTFSGEYMHDEETPAKKCWSEKRRLDYLPLCRRHYQNSITENSSLSTCIIRQTWEFDLEAGILEERATVENARQEFYKNRF
ncbi:hypothetical protein FRX31_013464, partial [Thalictrum thalictroides]